MKKMAKIIKGDVVYNDSCDYSQVKEIKGYLYCWSARDVSLPKLTTIGGYLSCGSARDVSLPKLTTIGGYLDCWSAKVSLPKLTTIGGYLYCWSARDVSLPKLTTIGGYLYCRSTKVSLPKLTTIGGYLDCWFARDVSLPKLTTIGGYLDCWSAKVSLPKLTTIGGYLDCWSAKVSLPKLTTIGGYLYCWPAKDVSLPKLTTIGGALDCRPAKDVSLPKLREKGCGDTKALAKVQLAFRRKGFVLFDGILASIVTTKERVYGKLHRLKITGQTQISFCIEAEGSFSHGQTVKEAKESLLYKISNRDKSAYSKWTRETTITKKQAIESYRVITGACKSGCRHFVEQHGMTNLKYKVGEIIEMTEGQYGNEQYCEFFTT